LKRIIAIIPARGGSKRLKRKNIHPVCGKPMIYWAMNACKESKYEIDVWVSTEDDEIAGVALFYGGKWHNRPKHLSEDNIYKQEAIRSAAQHIFDYEHRLTGKHPDIIISLQANSPTIKSKDIDEAIDLLIKHDRDEIISVDNNLMQNAAFRIFKGNYVFQKDLSTNCGVYVTDIHDVHTIDDVKIVEGVMNDN